MSLFDRAPNVLYNYTDQILDPRVYSAKNLWRRNDIRDDYLSNVVLFDEFFIRPGDSPDKYRYTFSDLTLADVLVMDYDMTARPMFTIPFQSMLNGNDEMNDEYVAIARLLLKRRAISKEMFAALPIPLGLSGRGGV